MFRTLTIAGITAIAMAAAPQAQARSNLDNFLIGATAIAILGGIASQQRHTQPVVTQRYVAPLPPRHYHTPRNQVVISKQVIVTKTVKPRRCLRQKLNHGQWITYYGKRCLAKYSTTRVYTHNR